MELDAGETPGSQNATPSVPAACKANGDDGLPVIPVPETVWPAKVWAKLAPGAVMVVPAMAPLKSTSTMAAFTGKHAASAAKGNKSLELNIFSPPNVLYAL